MEYCSCGEALSASYNCMDSVLHVMARVLSGLETNGSPGVSISTDIRRRASASLIRDVGYFLPKLKLLKNNPFKQNYNLF